VLEKISRHEKKLTAGNMPRPGGYGYGYGNGGGLFYIQGFVLESMTKVLPRLEPGRVPAFQSEITVVAH
jgi:hypothetical protein